MILIGETYFSPSSIIAVTDYKVTHHIIQDKCQIWCSQIDGGQFIVSVSKKEAVKLINDTLIGIW